MSPYIFPTLSEGARYRVLRNYDPYRANKMKVAPEKIKQKVCDFFRVTTAGIECKSRRRQLVEARQIAMYLIKKHSGVTLKKIAAMFEGRDHTTVIYSYKTVEDLMDIDPNYRENVIKIEDGLLD